MKRIYLIAVTLTVVIISVTFYYLNAHAKRDAYCSAVLPIHKHMIDVSRQMSKADAYRMIDPLFDTINRLDMVGHFREKVIPNYYNSLMSLKDIRGKVNSLKEFDEVPRLALKDAIKTIDNMIYDVEAFTDGIISEVQNEQFSVNIQKLKAAYEYSLKEYSQVPDLIAQECEYEKPVMATLPFFRVSKVTSASSFRIAGTNKFFQIHGIDEVGLSKGDQERALVFLKNKIEGGLVQIVPASREDAKDAGKSDVVDTVIAFSEDESVIALEMLQAGLIKVSEGLEGSSYKAAEELAQLKKIGIWQANPQN